MTSPKEEEEWPVPAPFTDPSDALYILCVRDLSSSFCRCEGWRGSTFDRSIVHRLHVHGCDGVHLSCE